MTERSFDLKVGDVIKTPNSTYLVFGFGTLDGRESVEVLQKNTGGTFSVLKTTVEHKLNLGVYRLERKGE